MADRIAVEWGFQQPERPARRGRQDEPLRILLMGDFSGRSQRESWETVAKLADRAVLSIDVDNFDAVLARLAPRLQLSLGTSPDTTPLSIDFQTLEDFHPDRLVRRLPLFQTWRQTRARLLDPATFAQTATELGGELAVSPPVSRGQTEPEPVEDEAAMIQRLLGRRPVSQPQERLRGEVDISRFIQTIVQPHVVPDLSAHQKPLIAAVDAVMGEQLRALLHQPAWQALEAAWRSVYKLVTELETDAALQLYLLDVTRAELWTDLQAAGDDLWTSGLYRSLVDRERGSSGRWPWSLWVGDYSFGLAPEDVALLAALGALGAQAGGPFLAAARPELLGCRSLAETPDPADWSPLEATAEQRWHALRTSRVAPWLGLALPRVLLRLPYGLQTDPIEDFAFEELPPWREHEAYLWGNPAFACASLLARAFLENGWSMEPAAYLDLVDLPAHTYQEEGETKLQPCAEVLLGERAAQAIMDRGIMPLLSYRNRNAVRLLGWRSLAEPPTALMGRWG